LRWKGHVGVSEEFPGRFQLIDDTALPAEKRPSPLEYAAWVKEKLARLQPGDEAILRFRRPRPTAAFSPQDTTHPDYERIKEQARANGFEPIERGTGGRLTMFDEHALAITLIWPHAEPHAHTIRRYEIFSNAIARALMTLGIDARVGELPNEYCPGKFSINAGGKVKLVGIAQRMNRRCVQMGAIIAVERSEIVCAAIADAYAAMALPFDAKTYGALAELAPCESYNSARDVIRQTVVAGLTF
jgi:octanoyl-[GcvH]:protein N-octanoyltransferase